MRAFKLGMAALVVFAMASVGGCEKIKECAGLECKGSIAEGSLEITGNSQIDGVLRGVGALTTAVTATTGEIEAQIRGVCTDIGLTEADCSGNLNTVVANVNAELSVAFTASASLTIDYEPAKCEANVDIAVEATARCEGEIDPGSIELSCEGQCSGGCTGECTGELSCDIEAPSITCEGSCEGSCELEAAARCEGTCNGTCDGTCSLQNADGECRGECDGDCTGSCEMNVAANCSGSCTGRCLVDQGHASCTAEASCRGSCDAECSGSCEGSVTPPSASVECQASAKAEASASVTCTPPELTIDFEFSAGADAEGRGKLTAAIASIKARFPLILAAIAKLGELDVAIEAHGEATANLSDTEVDIDATLIACLIEELPAAASMMADAGGKLTATASASASFSGCVSTQSCD